MTDSTQQSGQQSGQQFSQTFDALNILKEINMIMAPLAPSEYMVNVGATVGGVDKDTIKTIYEAMLGAHFLDPFGTESGQEEQEEQEAKRRTGGRF